jgi:hypothetical protein
LRACAKERALWLLENLNALEVRRMVASREPYRLLIEMHGNVDSPDHSIINCESVRWTISSKGTFLTSNA